MLLWQHYITYLMNILFGSKGAIATFNLSLWGNPNAAYLCASNFNK